MARLLRAAQSGLRSSSSFSSSSSSSSPKIIKHGFHLQSTPPRKSISAFPFHGRAYVSEAISKSPLESNILRILRKEILYQSDYAPPHQPDMKFKSFMVQDRPGEQWITMKGKFGDTEDIKIEVTMFDGYQLVPKLGDDSSGESVRLHISLLVDISKGNGSNELEFICSAWPDSLEVQKVYIIRRDGMLAKPYMGPDFGKLKDNIQKTFLEYLEARGINDELSIFLHKYMMNKDKTELIRWLGHVKSFVEK
ncbi:hypothetical protein FEM48_Zijuj06G0070100 [Ziziphus jujuba var. spinosa]|uniref:Mitochondrial glycoprotein n=1 Tax=Ziziphus jujuba var. spinosa TaxID=714518 RepID=A0A978V7U8_ZIZJJ|nr:hypothetical protein FEM48_Zijuj06G0070100 [Ziziphus jujuba var. spinosa]